MKIVDMYTEKKIAEVITNHSMTLDEAIKIAGEFVPVESSDEPDVLIDGEYYFYDDLEMVW